MNIWRQMIKKHKSGLYGMTINEFMTRSRDNVVYAKELALFPSTLLRFRE